MAKSLLKLQARELRMQGVSVVEISKNLRISKSTASHWVRDITLTVDQLEKLRQSSLEGAARGRVVGSLKQKFKRLKLIEEYNRLGIKTIDKLDRRDLLLVGLALYWAEGGKKNRRFEFCNSDPKMIRFLTLWLTKCLGVKREDFRCTVGINQKHMSREQEVKEFWSGIVCVPLSQFRRTSFKKVKNKKIYENFNEHYGTLSLMVAKSANLFYKTMGLVDGLIRQGSSVG